MYLDVSDMYPKCICDSFGYMSKYMQNVGNPPAPGVRGVGRGGKVSPGVISPMNPGPYRPLYLWGLHVGGFQANRPLPMGSSLAARWSPASLGTVTQRSGETKDKLL